MLILHLDNLIIIVVVVVVVVFTAGQRGLPTFTRCARGELVGLGVFGEMIRTHEPFAAFRTREAFLAGVSAEMALQFIGASECFATEQPMAAKRPFAGVPAQMRLQVRCLPVDLLADVTDVLPFRCRRIVSARRRLIETVRTATAFAASSDRAEDIRRVLVDTPPLLRALLPRRQRRGTEERRKQGQLGMKDLQCFMSKDGFGVQIIQRWPGDRWSHCLRWEKNSEICTQRQSDMLDGYRHTLH